MFVVYKLIWKERTSGFMLLPYSTAEKAETTCARKKIGNYSRDIITEQENSNHHFGIPIFSFCCIRLILFGFSVVFQ